jgi:hypothetical protein
MSLPIKTVMEDCDKIVAYLKSKASGATVAEAKGVIDSKHLDARKIKAYEAWGIVRVDGDRLILTEAGREIARNPDSAKTHYRRVIAGIPPYRSAIERAHHGTHSEMLAADVAANWFEHHKATLGEIAEGTLGSVVTCFFNLAEGAGLGTYFIGRAGKETRFEVNRAAISEFVEDKPVALHVIEDVVLEDEDDTTIVEFTSGPVVTVTAPVPVVKEELRVFITHGKNRDIVEQVETMLAVTEVAFEVAVESESTAIPVPEKIIGAMQRCNAAIICASVEEDRKDEAGRYTINENVLIEIGAAFVLYDKRVILLWDKRLAVPSNLQGLYRCEFEGDEIGFKEVMRLMAAVKEFRNGEAAA